MYFEKYLYQTFHTLFAGGQDRQELFVPVEVNSPDGNFDTLGIAYLILHYVPEHGFWIKGRRLVPDQTPT
jgi:hypothetical protein